MFRLLLRSSCTLDRRTWESFVSFDFQPSGFFLFFSSSFGLVCKTHRVIRLRVESRSTSSLQQILYTKSVSVASARGWLAYRHGKKKLSRKRELIKSRAGVRRRRRRRRSSLVRASGFWDDSDYSRSTSRYLFCCCILLECVLCVCFTAEMSY